MRCWHGYLSGGRCKWFVVCDDATATPSSLASLKSRLVWPFCCQLTQIALEKRLLNWCLCVLWACLYVVCARNLVAFWLYNAGPFLITLYLSVNEVSIPVLSTLLVIRLGTCITARLFVDSCTKDLIPKILLAVFVTLMHCFNTFFYLLTQWLPNPFPH